MNFIDRLADDDIKYICSGIPLEISKKYFQRHPKSFAKIKPGFRPTSLSNQKQVCDFLFINRKKPFISSFIDENINCWLDEVNKKVKEIINDESLNKKSALLRVLPYSFFADNVELYFKLNDEEYPNEYIYLLKESVKIVNDLKIKVNKLERDLKEKNREIELKLEELTQAKNELKMAKKKQQEVIAENKDIKCTLKDIGKLKDIIQSNEHQIDTLKKEQQDAIAEIKELKCSLLDSRELKNTIQSNEQQIDNLKKIVQEQKNYIAQMNEKFVKMENDKKSNEIQILEEYEKQQAVRFLEKKDSTVILKCPKDMSEFSEYLGYNFENIGIPKNREYLHLLKEHMCDILFQGKPIIINRYTGIALMKCVANALIGSSNVAILSYDPKISEKNVDDFLSMEGRVLCLDNFIGNFNETVLITICNNHKDKIIFLTVFYDKTLRFLPEEILNYSYYLNVNRIKCFSDNIILTEDPSVFDEIELINKKPYREPKNSELMEKILKELGFSNEFSHNKSSLVFDEKNLCLMLAFEILPFCADVLSIKPFNTSEYLVKFSGQNGKCIYKEFLQEWFAIE